MGSKGNGDYRSQDLDQLFLDNLLGSLMTHEILLKRDKMEEPKKQKNIAFNFEKEEKESHDSDDEDIVLLARKFNKFWKWENLIKEKFSKRIKIKKKKLRIDYPLLKKNARKWKKETLATWTNKTSSSSVESQEEDVVNLCLMAKEEDEVTSCYSNYSTSYFTSDELDDAFNELMEEYEKAILENNFLKKKIKSLKGEITYLKKKRTHGIMKRNFKWWERKSS